jgi:hypothetical protein
MGWDSVRSLTCRLGRGLRYGGGRGDDVGGVLES